MRLHALLLSCRRRLGCLCLVLTMHSLLHCRCVIADPSLDVLPLFRHHPAVLEKFMHPQLADKLTQLLEHPQVASGLRVASYNLEHLSNHLALILPAHWAPVGIGRDAPMEVKWQRVRFFPCKIIMVQENSHACVPSGTICLTRALLRLCGCRVAPVLGGCSLCGRC